MGAEGEAFSLGLGRWEKCCVMSWWNSSHSVGSHGGKRSLLSFWHLFWELAIILAAFSTASPPVLNDLFLYNRRRKGLLCLIWKIYLILSFWSLYILNRENYNALIGLKLKMVLLGVINSLFSWTWRYLNVRVIQLELTWSCSEKSYYCCAV